jgi:hypothetical protein
MVPVKTWSGVEGAALTTINSRKIRSRQLHKNDSDQGNFRLLRDTQVLGPRLVARTRSAKSRGSLGAMHTLGGNMRSDSDIKRDVEQELSWDPDIDPTDIAVAVKNGVVTLTGYVRSYAHKFAAERAAKRVVGVVGVANDLEVRLPQVDDCARRRREPQDVAAQFLGAHQSDRERPVGDARRRGRVELPTGVRGKGSALDQRGQGRQQLDPPTPTGSAVADGDQAEDRGSVQAQRTGRR